MKSKRKTILILFLILIVVILLVFGINIYLKDANRLTSNERKYLAEQSSVIQNINILNDVSVFGKNGVGVYYDFLDDFSREFGIEVNTVAFRLGDTTNGISLTSGNTLESGESSIYVDHYVLITKDYQYISSINNLNNQKIGLLQDNLSYINKYLNNSLSFTSYTSDTDLLNALSKNEVNGIIAPLHLYIEEILKNNYSISYHFSDISYYYKLITNNSTLGTILSKYYNTWSKKNFESYYEDHLFNTFIESLNISSTELDTMRSVEYNYGFVNNPPYEIIAGGNYGGIIAQYLKEFSSFSDTEINYVKYKYYRQFTKAISSNKVNLYLNYYTIDNTYQEVNSGIDIKYSVVVSKKDSLVVNSLTSLENKEVYVLENSNLYTYLINNTKLNVKTYSSESSLKKLIRQKKIIIIDSRTYDALCDGTFSNYSVRYELDLNSDYTFKINANDTFTKLFKNYLNFKDPHVTINKGIYNYEKTLASGTIAGTIARYFMYLLLIFIIIFLYTYKVAKRVKISKKIKKEDKLKYIDQLTSLKNRNYLNENLENWGKNTIYPQTIIVADLNNLQYINDTMGYEQGDIQIKAVANILVKNQLDNSDIIRTDGNEFVIYLVGYTTKQITSYIHKLNKEFKKLPYDYGVAICYSMIEDDIKSIEDAINEAVEDVKKQKGKKEVNDEKSI